MFGHVW
jgi:RTA1 like protein